MMLKRTEFRKVVTYLDLSEDLLPNINDSPKWHLAVYSLLSDAFLSSIMGTQKQKEGSKHLAVSNLTIGSGNPTWEASIPLYASEPREVPTSPASRTLQPV